MALPQLFGIIPTGSSPIITPSSAPSQTSFIYTIPTTRPFSHIVVFLLPGTSLPLNSAAAVYLSTSQQSNTTFKFLGGIGPGKESAIFKISLPNHNNENAEVDMDAPDGPGSGAAAVTHGSDITLGISIESAESVAAQITLLSSSAGVDSSAGGALVIAPRSAAPTAKPPDTVVLAQKIIKNAFNFLASFSGNVPVPGGSGTTGVEVVPLRAFEDWWRKFEGKVKNDPGFLERDGD